LADRKALDAVATAFQPVHLGKARSYTHRCSDRTSPFPDGRPFIPYRSGKRHHEHHLHPIATAVAAAPGLKDIAERVGCSSANPFRIAFHPRLRHPADAKCRETSRAATNLAFRVLMVGDPCKADLKQRRNLP
jgi:hypothetical protein